MAIYDINGLEIVTGGGSSGSSQSELQRKFGGKNVVWLGDSIHAYATPDGVTIPFFFGYHSGANIYNWAQGGMTMALTGVTNYDCYSGVGMVDAMVSRDFTAQEAHAGDNHGTEQGSFTEQVAEMKSLTLADTDYVIIEYGTNDCMKLVPTGTDGVDLDTTTTAGALAYMIKTLQTAKPTLGIAVCNVQPMTGYADAEHQKPYDSANQNEVIKTVCESLNVPMIDLCNLLGINDYTKATLLSDGLHRSHQGKLKQVQVIENQMCMLF